MGAFICQISKPDWEISCHIGVYGNREGSERSGTVEYFDRAVRGQNTIQSIIEDLIGMSEGDLVFFHVLREEESTIHGVYQISEEPFYNDSTRIWESNPNFVYPYRFCFEPHPDYISLCKNDVRIPVSEFYRSIEMQKVVSVLTLEREERGAAHAVKKILIEDAEEIIRLLYRNLTTGYYQRSIEFRPFKMDMIPLKEHIQRIGNLEFAIKGLVAYKLAHRQSDLLDKLPEALSSEYDFIVEAFLGQTIRRPIDIMCISHELPRKVTILEAKTDQVLTKDLIQCIKYKEVFKLRNIKQGSATYQYFFCMLGQRFQNDLIEYASLRNYMVPREKVVLLKYVPKSNGKDAIFELEKLPVPSVLPLEGATLATLSDKVLQQIASETLRFYQIFNRNRNPEIELKVKSYDADTLLLEKNYKRSNLTLGHILIHQIHNVCNSESFSAFLELLNKASQDMNGDLVSIEPILIATGYDNLVSYFVRKYNEFESPLLHQPILIYVG